MKRLVHVVRMQMWGFVCLLICGTAYGQAEKTLAKCQATASKETLKYVQQYVKAVGGCADQISKAVIQNQTAVPPGTEADAAKKCLKAFLKLENTDKPGKTIAANLAAKIGGACDPQHPKAKALHTEPDILGTGATLSESLLAENLGGWCSNFGGDGGIGDLDEWVSCLTEAGTCAARLELATAYPRLLDWLNAVKPAIAAIDPGCGGSCAGACTDQAVIDACNALEAVEAAIDGATDDDLPEIACGPETAVAAALPETGQTQCDQGNGTLGSCDTANPAGQDGELQPGVARAGSFTDNGNGTISDSITGLMWEKLDDNNSDPLHDRNTTFNWYNAFNQKIRVLNGDNTGCAAAGSPATCCTGLETGTCTAFVGHTDWRMPTVTELQSIINYGAASPSAYTQFNSGCASNCTATGTPCSCTALASYWSSTTPQSIPANAWNVLFFNGSVSSNAKSSTALQVRAVRGGL